MSDEDAEPRKVLLAQAREVGLKVYPRWSTDTLAEKVQEAIAERAAMEDAAIKQAADTWVYCIRDCFLGTEKHPARSVIRAPMELYRNWRQTGAARLADPDEVKAVQ